MSDAPATPPSPDDADRAFLVGLALAIRAARYDAGISARELSDRSGLSERFVVELEAGRGNPSVLRLRELAAALGVRPSELLVEAEGAEQAVAREPAPTQRRGFVALLGLRGAGKSTVGAQVAARVGVPFVELDARIEERAGMSAGAIFELHGASYYRRLEREVLDALLATGGPAVVATAGSLVTEHGTYERLRREATTIWLKATPEDHFARVLAQGDTRPMQDRTDAMNELRALLRARRALYEQAEQVVDTSRGGLARTIDRVERLTRRALARASTRGTTAR
jgi:XRE family aerobic/anaerobic benzoate catabolism transcriptional regulator